MSPILARLSGACLLFVAAALPVRAEITIIPVTSPGGITAWLYEDHTIPILTLEASFQGGAVLDPDGQEGATTLMAALLEEGSGDLDATGFAQARDDLSAQFSFDSSRDAVSVSAQMLSANRDASVDLLREALVAPRFDDLAFARVQGQLLANIRGDETDPGHIAGRAFFSEAFAGHPYARPTDGSAASVAALDVAAIRAAHDAALARDRLRIAVVGDIDPETLGPLLDRLFGDLPAEGPDLPPVATPDLPGALKLIDLDIPQSVVIFGQPGIARDDPDFVTAFVMDHILGGGGFGSRLTTELREKRGLTYGISTYLAPNDFGWLYLGQFATANASAGQAIDIVRAEWQRMAEGGVTAEELEAAKQYLTGAYPLRFDGDQRIADQLLGIQLAGLDLDYVNRRNALVEAVTVEDIARVAKRVLNPAELSFFVVGRPEGVTATN